MTDLDPIDWTRCSDPDAERSVLGSMIADKDCIARVMGVVAAGDFLDPRHALLFEILVDLDHGANTRRHVDVRIVSDALRSRNRLNVVPVQYVYDLTDALVGTAHVEDHAKIVADHAACRRALESLRSIQAQLLSGLHDPAKLASKFSTIATDLTKTSTSRSTVHVRDVLANMWEELGQEPEGAVTWQHADLTHRFGTLLPSETVLVSAEPAAGKSSLVLELAVHTALNHGKVLYFVFEMSIPEMGRRITAQAARVEESKLLGRMAWDEGDRDRIADANNRLGDMPLRISDDTSVTVSRMRAEIQHEKAHGGCVMVVVDYLQLVVAENPKAQRTEQIDELSRAFKKMAQDFGIIVVVVSSLNDTGDNQGAPKLRNLRGSRQLGFDANKIFMLYNDGEEIDADDPPPYRDVAIVAAKNRGGAKGAKCRMKFHGPTYSFAMLTDDGERQPATQWSTSRASAPSPARTQPRAPPAAVVPMQDPATKSGDPYFADGRGDVGELDGVSNDSGEMFNRKGN